MMSLQGDVVIVPFDKIAEATAPSAKGGSAQDGGIGVREEMDVGQVGML